MGNNTIGKFVLGVNSDKRAWVLLLRRLIYTLITSSEITDSSVQLVRSFNRTAQLIPLIFLTLTIMDSSKSEVPESKSDISNAHKTLWSAGLAVRKEVVGSAHVEKSLGSATSLTSVMQEYATEIGWGYIWTRPGLDRKTRSLLNIAMLTAMGKSTELGVHVRGAVTNGVSETELSETLLQAAGYAGFPAGMEGFRVTERVLSEMEAGGELPAGYRSK
jgi:4-carboxymuconolactone decarboxylase